MRSPLALAAAAVLVAALPAPAHAEAGAMAEECLGQPATIVSENGYAVGTEGDDVLVVRVDGNGSVGGKGGDDLICVFGVMQRGTDEPPSISGGEGTDSVQVRGSGENDIVDIFDGEQLDVRMGRGFDQVRLFDTPGQGTIDGGPGGNAVAAYGFDKVSLDLEDHLLEVDGGVGGYTVTRFDNGLASARRVRLTGDASGNKLGGFGCVVTLVGGRGNDFLRARTREDDPTCTSRGARIFGLKGKDRMDGSMLDDVLLGGAGRDSADGNHGDDRCVAEKLRACER